MGKIKTHKASAKRFDTTAGGKVKMNHAQHRHKLGLKTAKRKRNLRKGTYADTTNEAAIKRMILYK